MQFKTKKECKEYFKKVLNGIIPLDNEAKENFKKLIKRHPDYELKKGAGIKDIYIGKTQYNNNCFHIWRTDNTHTDISYLACLTKQSDLSKIKKACRNAIRPIIKQEQSKVNYGVDTCQFTGEVLTRENTHIDHYNLKFAGVFNMWIMNKEVKVLMKKLNNDSLDLETRIYFTCKQTIEDFVDFHNSNTHLRAISKTANLKLR